MCPSLGIPSLITVAGNPTEGLRSRPQSLVFRLLTGLTRLLSAPAGSVRLIEVGAEGSIDVGGRLGRVRPGAPRAPRVPPPRVGVLGLALAAGRR